MSQPMTISEMARKGGRAGRGASKVRSPEVMRRVTKARLDKQKARKIEAAKVWMDYAKKKSGS